MQCVATRCRSAFHEYSSDVADHFEKSLAQYLRRAASFRDAETGKRDDEKCRKYERKTRLYRCCYSLFIDACIYLPTIATIIRNLDPSFGHDITLLQEEEQNFKRYRFVLFTERQSFKLAMQPEKIQRSYANTVERARLKRHADAQLHANTFSTCTR